MEPEDERRCDNCTSQDVDTQLYGKARLCLLCSTALSMGGLTIPTICFVGNEILKILKAREARDERNRKDWNERVAKFRETMGLPD